MFHTGSTVILIVEVPKNAEILVHQYDKIKQGQGLINIKSDLTST
jgi:hypothetical protein